MQKPYRHLNLLVPFDTYEELRKYSIDIGKPYAEIVRGAIALILEENRSRKIKVKNLK
jgi:hypothetical protein|tara:strand:- start:259 stop:432 length:174 start_codon:yes stop_codon:yes gene_type:complete